MFTSTRGVLALALVCAANDPAAAQERWKDRHGDLLPPDAAARIGTVRLRTGSGPRPLAISPNDKLFVTYSEDTLQLWDARTGELVRTIETVESRYPTYPEEKEPAIMREHVFATAFAADSRRVHALTNNGLLRACDVTTGKWSEPLARTAIPNLTLDRIQHSHGRASRDGTQFFYTPRNIDGDLAATEMLVVGKDKPVRVFEPKTFGHLGSMSADNQFAVVFKQGRAAHVWDLKADKPVTTFTAPEPMWCHTEISPDGKYLAAVCGPEDERRPWYRVTKLLICWEIATKKEQFRTTGWEPRSVTYSPDGAWLVGFGYNEISVADARTGKIAHRLHGHAGDLRFTGRAFSADGRRLVTSGSDGTIIFWDLATGKAVLDFDSPRGAVDALAISPDGKTVFTGWHQWCVGGLWDADTGKRKQRLDPRQWANPVVAATPLPLTFAVQVHDFLYRYATNPLDAVFTPDGKHVVVGCGHRGITDSGNYPAQLWSVADGKLVREFPGHKESVHEVRISPNGKQLATWDRVTCKVRLWEVDTGKLTREIEWVGRRPVVYPDGVKSTLDTHEAIFTYTNAGALIGVATERVKRDTEVVDLLTGKVLGKWKTGERASPMAISPDGQVVALWEPKRGGGDPIVVRRVATGEVVFAVTPSSSVQWFERVVRFSPDSKFLALRGSVYDAATGREIRTLKGHSGDVSGVAFSADGKRVATGGYDSTVLIWDLHHRP